LKRNSPSAREFSVRSETEVGEEREADGGALMEEVKDGVDVVGMGAKER